MGIGTKLGIVALMLLPAGVAGAQCPSSPNFSGTAKPSTTALALLLRLEHAADYGAFSGHWLAQRLFPLADSITLAGTIVPGCFNEAADGDLEFDVRLSQTSYEQLQAFFDPSTSAPAYVHVEIVKWFPAYCGTTPFRTWHNGCVPNCVQFQTDTESKRDMRAYGGSENNDWQQTLKARCARVTGALVVDMAGHAPGTGTLELHPAEFVAISSSTPCPE